MITVGICDDEPKLRHELKTLLERKLQLMGESYKFYEYGSGQQLLSSIELSALNILFLDIEMPGPSGMDTAKLIRDSGLEPILIFVTAYPDFVFQGYEVHAFHYILKPYEETKVLHVLEQAISICEQKEDLSFSVSHKSGIQKFPYRTILAFSSDRRKVRLMSTDKEIEFYGKLTDIEKDLPSNFIRIHNRYIVNLNFVSKIDNKSCTCNNQTFPISETYRQAFEIEFAKNLLH